MCKQKGYKTEVVLFIMTVLLLYYLQKVYNIENTIYDYPYISVINVFVSYLQLLVRHLNTLKFFLETFIIINGAYKAPSSAKQKYDPVVIIYPVM